MIIKHNDSYYEDWQEGVRLLGELYHDIRWREVIKNTYGLQPEYYVNIENDKVVGGFPAFIACGTLISLTIDGTASGLTDIIISDSSGSGVDFSYYDDDGGEDDVYGCTDADATNYNPDATVDDGSCEYDEDVYGCTDEGACNFNPDANVDDGSCEYGELTSDWNIQIIASMQPWNILDTIFDENNILGVSDSTSDDFDSMDAPEPPSSPGNWISGYFYHPEWDSIFGDNFTQEYKSNQFCGTKEWDFIVKANSPGPMELFFIFNNIDHIYTVSERIKTRIENFIINKHKKIILSILPPILSNQYTNQL